MRTPTRQLAAVVLIGTAALSLALGGTAYAYWTTTGTGTGTAASATAGDLVVTSTAAIAGLYPTATGLPGGSLSVRNPNGFAVSISSAFGSANTDAAGCTDSVVTFAVAAGAPTSIAAGATVTVPFTASMSNQAEDACQGAVFTATLTVDGQSAP